MKSLAITAALVLCSVSLFASADLVTDRLPARLPDLRAGYNSGLSFQVRNNGPDAATAVKLSISSDVPNTCSCDLGDIPPGQTPWCRRLLRRAFDRWNDHLLRHRIEQHAGPNPSNNSASVVVDRIGRSGSLHRPLDADSHRICRCRSRSTSCSATAPHHRARRRRHRRLQRRKISVQVLAGRLQQSRVGRVVCHLDSLAPTLDGPGPAFSLHFVAPTFTETDRSPSEPVVTEREHDFDPISNTTTTTIGALQNVLRHQPRTNDGAGSLRQAILDANAQCLARPAVCDRLPYRQASPKPWKTIHRHHAAAE